MGQFLKRTGTAPEQQTKSPNQFITPANENSRQEPPFAEPLLMFQAYHTEYLKTLMHDIFILYLFLRIVKKFIC